MGQFDSGDMSYEELKDALPFIGTEKTVLFDPAALVSGAWGPLISQNKSVSTFILCSVSLPRASAYLLTNSVIFLTKRYPIITGTQDPSGIMHNFDLGTAFFLIPPRGSLYLNPLTTDIGGSDKTYFTVYEYTMRTLPSQRTREVR